MPRVDSSGPRRNRQYPAIVASILTVTALASLVAVASPATPPLTPLERQHLVAHLEMTAAWLADEVANLTPAQISFRREPGAWTIAEVVDHLVVVAPIYWQDLQAALKQPAGGRASAMTDADVLWYGIDRTRREQAIAGERTSGAVSRSARGDGGLSQASRPAAAIRQDDR